MFGFKKKNAPMKTVEDFLKSEDARIPGMQEKTTTITNGGSAIAKLKPLIAPFVALVIVLVLVIAAFGKISALNSEMSGLKSQINNGEVKALKSQLSGMEAKLEKSDKEMESLKNEISRLGRELETEKSRRVKVKAAAPAKKPAAAPDKKKKTPAKHRV
ncbi:MAG: hypothetical protein A4E57_02127 [Syntrophorhabdaceae bacterium PtaU1.Bin034]|jgi:hypothetical protein|nr:MAG: hypothetical protein A4E57_02127 [Syntrophorhabdaceae bacterium PtaU1.Bin034]